MRKQQLNTMAGPCVRIRNEEWILPSHGEVFSLWAGGLAEIQTTSGAGIQAIPAPIVNRNTQFDTLFAWMQLTTQGMERPYDC